MLLVPFADIGFDANLFRTGRARAPAYVVEQPLPAGKAIDQRQPNSPYMLAVLATNSIHPVNEVSEVAAMDVTIEGVEAVEHRQRFLTNCSTDFGECWLLGQRPVKMPTLAWEHGKILHDNMSVDAVSQLWRQVQKAEWLDG